MKRKLQQTYPQLTYLNSKNRNTSEVVLSEIRHVSEIIKCESSTESESEDDDEGFNIMSTVMPDTDMYSTARLLNAFD